jgi:uncharacterized protein YqhQ
VADRPDHFYGGQALLEGVMMRGRDHWAVAVRRPDHSIHVESHDINALATRYPILGKPGFRGVMALGQALSIGVKALTVSANQSVEDEERLTPRQMGFSMAIAFVVFVAVFVIGPYLGFRAFRHVVPSSFLRNLLEGLLRVALFLGYLILIGQMKDIRRVFEYHGAEHKTIAAYEHGDPLEPAAVDRYSTLHVRCGTNFLLIVMLLAVLVYSFFAVQGLLAGLVLRVVTIPVIAGISYELLRLGAKHSGSMVMRAVMAPGLWLQKITTKPPDRSQIEVAIASFEEVLRREGKVPSPPD